MAYTPEELRQIVLDIVNAGRESTWTAQNDRSIYRGVHIKYDQQLIDLENVYRRKLLALEDYYKERAEEVKNLIQNFDYALVDFKGEIQQLREKVLRIADKWWTVKWEIEGRSRGFFNRTPVGTLYYIDLDAGNDGDDGLSFGNAWLTLAKYTTTTARSAGDIAYVRANTTETVAALIECDEDGNSGSLISIIGCDATTNDPWGDSSDVKPILDLGANAYGLYINRDDYWWVELLELKNGTRADGALHIRQSKYAYIKSCKVHDGGTLGIQILTSPVVLDSVEVEDNVTINVKISTQAGILVKIKDSTIDGGAGGTVTGVSALNAEVEITGTDIGVTNAHSTADIQANDSFVKLKDVNYSAANKLLIGGYGGGFIYCEDADQTYGAGYIVDVAGVITKDTGVKTGSADYSLKMEPGSTCGLHRVLTAHRNSIIDSPFVVEGTASEEITCTIKIRSLGTWGTYPTNTELYLEASYYDNAGDAGRSTDVSTEVLSHASDWVEFSITCTPARDGPIYINVYMKLYEDAGDGCYVNGEVVTS